MGKELMMEKRYVLAAAVLGAALAGALSTGRAWSDDDYRKFKKGLRGGQDVAKAENPAYAKECGSCHFAYQPGLLPSSSWERLMAGLADHFGDNAELPPEDQKALTAYLTANSADKAGQKAAVKTMKSLKGSQPPLRITQSPYFVHEHREIPQKLYKDNPKVKSLSHCNRCHVNAGEGSFNEHEVNIPGVGRWDD